jgi:hypothetical protein
MKERTKNLLTKAGFTIVETDEGWTSEGNSQQFENLILHSFHEYEALLKQHVDNTYGAQMKQYATMFRQFGIAL